jgi:hypothetical protein
LDHVRYYSYDSSLFADLPEWLTVGSERGSFMYFPEPWEVVGDPNNPGSTGFCGWVPFYARLDEPLSYGSPAVPKTGYFGFAEVYSVPESTSNAWVPCKDCTQMISGNIYNDPTIFTSYTGPANLRGIRVQDVWGVKPYYRVRIFDEEGNDLITSYDEQGRPLGSSLWGSWRSVNGSGTITHLNVVSGLPDWYSRHGDIIHTYVEPCDSEWKPITNDTILEDWFPGFGPHYRQTWELIEHSNDGRMRLSHEFMRIDLNGYGLPGTGYRVGARLKKSDGTYVGLSNLKVHAEYDAEASAALHPDLPNYNPWVT